jgi:TRAP-type C4-dicarboxylate transport system permease small subunit
MAVVPPEQSPAVSSVRLLGRVHDRLTHAGFVLAALLVAAIAASFCYEVVSRYVFSAPTSWTNDLGSYLLCAVIFLTMPELTRRNAHVSVNLVPDRLPPEQAHRLRIGIGLLAAAACLAASWITGNETWRQYVQGVSTISSFSIPKWWVSILIPYGMLSSAIHFLRQLGRPPAEDLPVGGAGA